MTNQNQNPEASRPSRFTEAFHRIFGGIVTVTGQGLSETGKTLYTPSAETQDARRNQLRQIARDHNSNGGLPSLEGGPALTIQDQQDIDWLQTGERTGTEVVTAIDIDKGRFGRHQP